MREEQLKRLPASVLVEGMEGIFSPWKKDRLEALDTAYASAWQKMDRKIVVLDDDPTGTQTVHDVPVYTGWTTEQLEAGFSESSPLFFVLTNSRSFSSEVTSSVHEEIAKNTAAAAKITGKDFLIISRGDSTLRGNYPLETEVLRKTLELETGVQMDGEILWPFFEEGGRFTIGGVHYVREKDELVPAAQTEFAKDATFAYHHSDLAEYIEEKSGQKTKVSDVVKVSLSELREGTTETIEKKLLSLQGFRYIVPDATCESDVKAFALVLLHLMEKGRHYSIRSAAAAAKVLGNVSSRPLLSREELLIPGSKQGGLVIVGSHVAKTTAQLNALHQSDRPLAWIEFVAERYKEEGGLEDEAKRCCRLAEEAMEEGTCAVVYTSRTLINPDGATKEEKLDISVQISNAVTSVVSRLQQAPGFLIAKGGITSSDVAVKALGIQKAYVTGQAAPGIPVWRTGEEARFPGISYIIFPGNVGGEETLRTIVDTLA